MLNRAAEARVMELQRAAADVGKVPPGDADRADRVPYADHLDDVAEVVGAAQQRALLEVQLLRLIFHVQELVDGARLLAPLVALEQLREGDRGVRRQQAACGNEPRQAARCKGAATEAEDIDLVVEIVVLGQPPVAVAYVFGEARAD